MYPATYHRPNRRSFIKTAGAGIIGLSLPVYHPDISLFPTTDDEYFVYVGTYTNGSSEGIYIFKLNVTNGVLSDISVTPAINPSFLGIHPSRSFLYAVNEVIETEGIPGGGISAFKIDRKTGLLSYLNHQLTLGGSPCYVAVDSSGRYVLVANYHGGNVAMLPVAEDGRLLPVSDIRQHTGSSINRERQTKPHAHAIVLDPANRFALAADLGTDHIMVYRLDLDSGKLIPHEVPALPTRPGAGPRHLVFSPDARFVYVIQELDSTISVFSYEASAGTLDFKQYVSTLPTAFSGFNSCADIHLHPSGRFLYGSNRGHDSIVIFAVDEETGTLTYVGHQPTGGRTPRNFAVDPTGTLLLAANQNSDSIVTFWIDQESGRLTPTGHMTRVPAPVCLKLMMVE